ncbi:MAG TPA: alpha-galactosidase [Treponemataceae bacterium]|nr:alpha-galactosidase [Treponemataceae bacterium]
MIIHDPHRNVWILETDNSALALGLTPEGIVLQTWFGMRFTSPQDYPLAELDPEWASFSTKPSLSSETFSPSGGGRFNECCLKLEYADGLRDLVLEYYNFKIEEEKLFITLKDPVKELFVELLFEVFPQYDLFRRSATVINDTQETVKIEQILCGSIYPKQKAHYRLSHLVGRWAGETNLEQIFLAEAKTIIESRRGFTSHHANPFFALDKDGLSSEDSGEVYFGELAWSGDWKIVFDRDNFGYTRVSAGINDYDFRLDLASSSSFTSPPLLFGWTDSGFGRMSQNLHRWQREILSPSSNRQRRVLYNSWEATGFDVNEESQKNLAKIAASVGVECFVMDDGWFGKRNNDSAGLGDWHINETKFPNGLKPLISYVHSLGMEFGLWVEPEMVNPDSDLYRAHPEWAYHFPQRARSELRNQLVLNLSLPEVEDYVYISIDSLLKNNAISFIKWDLNRSITERGSTNIFSRSACMEHIHAVYRILSRLRAKHPEVTFQSCSGGGGRVDLGILSWFDQVWTSDNTDAVDRLSIQNGFSYGYGSHLMEAWVTGGTNWLTGRTLPLLFRFHVAMAGILGIGEDLNVWTNDEKEMARALVAIYKDIRPVVLNGNLYRLISPKKELAVTSFMYVSQDQKRAILFAFRTKTGAAYRLPIVYPRGLSINENYCMHEIQTTQSTQATQEIYQLQNASNAQGGKILSGSAWMAQGFEPKLPTEYSSIIIEFTACS